MNEDRVQGAASDLGGKVKDGVGGLLGDDALQAEGKADQISGSLQKTYGAAKDSVRETAGAAGGQIEDFVHERPVLAMLSAAAIGFALSLLMQRR